MDEKSQVLLELLQFPLHCVIFPLFLEAAKQQKFCHGSYNYHNLLDSRMGLATVCFENAGIGVPVFDLYQMMRKY